MADVAASAVSVDGYDADVAALFAFSGGREPCAGSKVNKDGIADHRTKSLAVDLDTVKKLPDNVDEVVFLFNRIVSKCGRSEESLSKSCIVVRLRFRILNYIKSVSGCSCTRSRLFGRIHAFGRCAFFCVHLLDKISEKVLERLEKVKIVDRFNLGKDRGDRNKKVGNQCIKSVAFKEAGKIRNDRSNR